MLSKRPSKLSRISLRTLQLLGCPSGGRITLRVWQSLQSRSHAPAPSSWALEKGLACPIQATTWTATVGSAKRTWSSANFTIWTKTENWMQPKRKPHSPQLKTESIITSFGTSTKLEVINHIELCRSVARLSLPKTSMTCRTRTPSTPSPRTSPTAKASISWGMCASKTYWASLKKTIQTTENLQFSKNTSLPTWTGTVTTLSSLQSKLASTPKRSHPASRQAWLRRARTQNNKLNNLR